MSVGADLIQSLEQLKDAKEMMTEVRTHTHHTKRLLTTDDALAASWAASLTRMGLMVRCVLQADEAEGVAIEDERYKAMNCPLTPVDKGSEEWRMIADYVARGHGHRKKDNSLQPHHTVELVDVLATVRPEEETTFTTDPELLKNRQLLWHGSGMGNWGSILKTGLRIAPPEAPSTGWLFDKGATCCSCPC